MTSADTETADLVVVGAGIVGLAHALAAAERGLSVVVVERNERAIGASVRNFGHVCMTAQAGTALGYATTARETWLRLAKQAGLWLREGGAVLVARAADEYAVLEEFAAARDGQVRLLDAAEVAGRVPAAGDVVGGAFFPDDVRVDPRTTAGLLADHLAGQGVRFRWLTTVHGIEPGLVRTSRGDLRARNTVVAVGHNVDRHFPELAEQAGVRRCTLHMLRVSNLDGRRIDPAVLSGHALLRYDGFADCPSLPAVRDRLRADHPELVDAALNLMYTQRPDGDLLIGDTHHYARTPEPFRSERLDDLVLTQTARLLGARELTVRERWRGVYAAAPEPFLVGTPADGVRVVSVTSGIGMTTAFGLAPTVLDDLLG